MNTENYDQVTVCRRTLSATRRAYLQPEMKVTLAVHEGVPVSIELPQKATLEVVETEPAIKSQTAVLLLQARHAVQRRAHHGAAVMSAAGTRIVVMTADGSYVERSKDD